MKTYSASLDKLHEMLQWVHDSANHVGFSNRMTSQIVLAAEEALVNVIYYAYPHRQGTLDLSCEGIPGKELRILIRDYGIPYDPLAHRQGGRKEDPHVGGYGIYFIRKVMDHVDYMRENNSNVLILVKYLF